MLPDQVSNPGPLTYESGALPTALHSLAHLKDRDGIANSVNSDQTAPWEQSDLRLHCLLKPNCHNI